MQHVRRSCPRSWLARARAALVAGALLATVAPAPASAQRLTATRTATVVRFTSEAPLDLDAVPVVLRQPLTLRLDGVSLERALGEIMTSSGVSLTYSRSVVPLDRTVSVHVENEPVVEALRQLLRGTGVEMWISAEGRMALVPAERAARADRALQTGIVVGTVTASGSGEPHAGATVSVVGTRIGATTDDGGRYRIVNVPLGTQTIRAQRIGFEVATATVTVADGETVTADLALDVVAVQLGEVVAIGYGETERREITGSIASVSSEQIASAPVPSLDQALLGRAAGVQVMSASGQPGAGAMVRIRGGNSISAGNEPLYVVDGVPVVADADGATTTTIMSQGLSGISPLAAISPNDIESIEVLKDASATSIYGARAANGVVLITTKRGRTGENVVTGGVWYGQQEVRNRLDVMNAQQFATMVNEAYTNAGQAPPYSAGDIAGFGAGTDWQDAIFQTAPSSNVDLGFSGGDEDTRYYLSGNLFRSEGVVIGTHMDRGSARLNLDQEVSGKFRVGTRATFSRSEGQVLANGGAGSETASTVLNAILAPPTLPIYAEGGEYFTDVNMLSGRPFSNPVATALEITNEERQNRLVGNAFAEYDLMSGLRLRSTFGVDFLSSLQNFYSPANTYPGRNVGGAGSRGTATTTLWQNENTINWRREIGELHDLDLLGGLTLQRITSENVSGTAQGFLTDRLRENALNTAQTFVGVWTGAPRSSLLSYFARANWDIADKYLFTLTGRIDGSSKFGTGNQYGFFPSGAVAWRASEEPFVQELGVFDELKLRASYGRTGNQDIGNFASLATLGSTVYVFGGVRAVGYAPSTIANPDLKWETTDQLDIGVDAAVLRNRLWLTADWYDKKTNDLLLYVPVPATSGFGSSLQNIGSVRNRGLELSVNTVNLAGNFGWETTLNLAWNRNEVLSLGVDDEIIAPVGVGAGANQNPTILRVGEPTNAFFGWVYDRTEGGVVMYRDLNGDGDITPEDRTIIGSAQPDYTGGLNNRFTWRDFDLTVFVQWSVGNDIYNINRALLTSAAGNVNQLVDVVNAGSGGIPEPKVGNTFDSNPSTLFVEDGSYIRGKNIRLGWTVPAGLLARGGFGPVTSLQLYASAQNFFTITDYTGFDPEISEYASTNLAQGFDFGTYPQPRQITIGLNAGF
jgi:TonB-linked SusC/RagA family outer membrane protein